MGKLDVKSEKAGGKLKLTMAGVIDEDVDFTQFPVTGFSEIELRLGGVRSINSCGIREWIKWLADAGEARIQWFECPKVIIDQVNMVDGFLTSHSRVQSFYVPYYNDASGSEKNVLFRFGVEFSENQVTPPAPIKDEEGNDMEMDVIEAKYFKFIRK